MVIQVAADIGPSGLVQCPASWLAADKVVIQKSSHS